MDPPSVFVSESFGGRFWLTAAAHEWWSRGCALYAALVRASSEEFSCETWIQL